jgi:hypothetical protein
MVLFARGLAIRMGLPIDGVVSSKPLPRFGMKHLADQPDAAMAIRAKAPIASATRIPMSLKTRIVNGMPPRGKIGFGQPTDNSGYRPRRGRYESAFRIP